MSDFLASCPIDKALAFAWPADCYKLLLSKFLSTGILAGSVALKLPQILNIISTKDVLGLSPMAFYTEVPITLCTILYNYRLNYPFISYGESVMICIQNFILVLLLWQFMKPKPSMGLRVGVLASFVGLAAGCFVMPAEYLYILPLAQLPLVVYARLVQIFANFSQGTTGQLSSITTILTFLGSLARIFTTIQDVGLDWNLLAGFVLGAVLSFILLAQVRPNQYNLLSFPPILNISSLCRLFAMNILV
jgi:uncharacterized protein with PQ loop repeat